MIAPNELWGGWQPTPLTPTAEQYRANVLTHVRRLAERGARPALLVSSRPYTGGDAAAWWQAIGAVSDIVLEKYPNANTIWRAGAIDGSRQTAAPPAVFQLSTGRKSTITTAEGRFTVWALGETTALGAVTADAARPAIACELRAARRAEAYAAWSIRMQKAAQARLVCQQDKLPELGGVRLSSLVPFLSLDEIEAASWAPARNR